MTGGANRRSGIVVAQEATDAASVFPIQLRHTVAPSRSIQQSDDLEAVELLDIEFEDCSSRVNLDAILEHAESAAGQSEGGLSDDDLEIIHHENGSNSKRKAANDHPSEPKRSRVEGREAAREDIALAATRCRFDVLVQEKGDVSIACRIKSLAKTQSDGQLALCCDFARLRMAPRAADAAEGKHFLTSFLIVEDKEGYELARLPIVDTDAVAHTHAPHQFSNGLWLASLPALLDAKNGSSSSSLLRAEISLHVVTTGPTGPYKSFDESFVLELRINVYLRRADAETAWSVEEPYTADHLDRLVRFAFPQDDHEALIRSQDEVGASLIYSSMRSSTLPSPYTLQPRLLNAALFPFQRRSVHFLLGREGKALMDDEARKDGEISLRALDGAMTYNGVSNLGLFWRALGGILFYNAFTGAVTTDEARTRLDQVHGGILAEEMGLGKTVEVFALILLNADPARSLLPVYHDTGMEVDIWPTKTTLVVAPEVLRQQWLDEASLHAPELRAFNYLGYKEATNEIPAGTSWPEFARRFDVIVVSFDTLRKELNVARKAPSRSRRFERKYERPRSLLVQLAFHRVVMDEVQLVGHSSAAETASMIARKYSIAVSGTPLKRLSDLHSLFQFLRVPGPIASNARWSRLLQPALAPTLVSALGMLATRHTKAQVRKEMVLPQQTRVLMPIEFTAVESAFYRDINQRLLNALGLDTNDFVSQSQLLSHLRDVYGEDASQLRSTLLSLRQACTHPQIAGSSVRGTALANSQTIRSMDEVLTIMIEGSKAEHDTLWHSLVQKQIDRAVLLLQRKDFDARHDIAKAMLAACRTDIEARVANLTQDMERAKLVGPLYRFEKLEDGESREGSVVAVDEEDDTVNTDALLATQAEREQEHLLTERRVQRRKHLNVLQQRMRSLLEQLHRCHHFTGNVYFQLGDKIKQKEDEAVLAIETNEDHTDRDVDTEGTDKAVHDISTTPDDDVKISAAAPPEVIELKRMEDEAYDRAEDVRQRLLKETRKVVEGALVSAERSKIEFGLDDIATLVEFGNGGIRSTTQFEMLAELQDKLNAHAELTFAWREEIWQRLSKAVNRVVSAEDDQDDQYQENLDAQTEAETLLEMYRVLCGEREFMLTGIRIEGSLGRPQLYTQMVREVPQFERAQQRLLQDPEARGGIALDDWLPTEQELGVMRQQLRHFSRLERQKNRVSISREAQQANQRARVQRRTDHGREGAPDVEDEEETDEEMDELHDLQPFETLFRDLREITQATESVEETTIIRATMDKIRRIIAQQKQMLEKLKRESAAFSTLWNARAAYFKQIQDLSDQVGDIATNNIEGKLNDLQREEATLKRREEMCSGRLRYLRAIEEEANEDVSGVGQEAEGVEAAITKTCPICTEPLVKVVVLDSCGHTTCEACFRRWTAQRGQCPMCKSRVNLRNVYRATYNKEGRKRRVVDAQGGNHARQTQGVVFNLMQDSTLQSIQSMPIHSSLGSKLDLLTRHLLYIQRTQPGIKSIVFTAFLRGISLVGDALRLNGIRFVTLERGGWRGGRTIDTFKTDADVNVLLLHSEAQSSGLNLVCAQNIFLLEPLVNHSIELQAIGRVHRIGQTRPTTVFCYEVNRTVEQRIVDMARRRNQSLFTRENCVSHDLKDSAELSAQSQKQRGVARAAGGREGEFVARLEDVLYCLFDGAAADDEDAEARPTIAEEDDKQAQSSKHASTSSSVLDASDAPSTSMTEEESELARARRLRLEAIERRMAAGGQREGGEEQTTSPPL